MKLPKISRRRFLASTALLGAGTAFGEAGAVKKRPNLLLITTDQQHWMARGAVDPFFETPALDALAQSGTVFENAFCTTPQCSASRSSLYTGCYPHKTSVLTNIGSGTHLGGVQAPLPATFETIGSRLRHAGYRTAYFGKWHMGNNDHYSAHFDRADLDGEPHTGATDKAISTLREWAGSAGQPFCVCVNYINPHDVYDFVAASRKGGLEPKGVVPHPSSWAETFSGKPKPQRDFAEKEQGAFLTGKPDALWEAYREFYRDKVRLADAETGRLLQHLELSGLADNTVVAFTADHGDMDTQHRLVFKGPFMYESLVHVPLIIRVPGACPGIAQGFVTPCDILPSFCALAGAAFGEVDGVSLAEGLMGGSYPERDYVVGQYYGKQKWVNPIRMLRTRQWKYNRYLVHGEELYDLRNDPQEMVNLAADGGYNTQKAELAALLDQWMTKSEDTAFSTYWPTNRDGTRFSA